MNEVIAYQCEHCPKIYTAKKVCKAHEKKCYSNPATKSCTTCAYFHGNNQPFCTEETPFDIVALQTGCSFYAINPDLID